MWHPPRSLGKWQALKLPKDGFVSRGGVSEVPQVCCSAWEPVGWDREVHGPRMGSDANCPMVHPPLSWGSRVCLIHSVLASPEQNCWLFFYNFYLRLGNYSPHLPWRVVNEKH